ncbi:MAG TPA: hypothetical protein VFW86_02790, partial [Candidatus Limnocylindrales bacterium]|nr:hypothetical protein [Candidatus Limnocylindrales bacterium]
MPLGPLVIGGQPWEPGSVLDADPAAVRLGVHTGQPLTVAGRLAPEATFLPADPGAWRSALEQALEVVAGFCPAVEAEVEPGRPGFGRILLGIEGLDRLWGDEPILVARLADALALILPGSPLAGIANTRFGAAVAAVAAAPAAGERLALAGSPPLIAAPAGNAAVEAAFLAPRPIRLLTADLEIRERFRLFGLTRIGDLAQLARSAVVARFGARGGELHDLARGLDGRPLVPRRPVERLRAEAELEPPVETLDPLRFVLHRLTGALCDQLAARGTGAARAILVLDLASGSRLRLDQALPEPVARAELIERLLVARLEAEHPAEPVGRIGL